MIGPHQRTLLRAMRDGAELYNDLGTWVLRRPDGTRQTQPRERCMGLFARGYILSVGDMRYVLTEKGKRAL